MPNNLKVAIEQSKEQLEKIGESDWTPQDHAHSSLVQAAEEAVSCMEEADAYLADPIGSCIENSSQARKVLRRELGSDAA